MNMNDRAEIARLLREAATDIECGRLEVHEAIERMAGAVERYAHARLSDNADPRKPLPSVWRGSGD